MAAIRVFLLTCRRPQMLPAALASLRAQTFTDWICELHNDAPEDDSPRRLLAQIPDPRITLHQHSTNGGAVATFNHAFAAGPEPFTAILEDDNRWDPEFLATAHTALLTTPDANVAFANLRLRQELPDGSWRDLGRTVWKTSPGDHVPRLFHWPQPLQAFDALHSNGAMLVRRQASAAALVPPSTPFAIIEPVRERLLAGGWLLLPQPLGDFSRTINTARSDRPADWAQSQLLLAASYFAAVQPDDEALGTFWKTLRSHQPPTTTLLFHLALSGVNPAAILRHARVSDWLRFLAGALRHPVALIRALRFRRRHTVLWEILRPAALQRSVEARARESSPADPAPLWTKHLGR